MKIEQMTVVQLRKELEDLGEDTKGLKAELVKRLKAAKGSEGQEVEVEKKEKSSRPTRAAASKRKKQEEEEEEDEKEEEESEDEAPAAKKAKPAVSKRLTKAKVDEHCPLANSGTVYSNGEDTYDVMLNQTNIGNNNNKYYVIQMIESGGRYYVWNRWGRVGEVRQNQTALKNCGSLDAGLKEFNKKFKDKTKNDFAKRANFKPVSGKYTLIEMSYSDDEGEEEVLQALGEKKAQKQPKQKPCTLDGPTQDLIRLIFDHDMFKEQMQSFNIDIKKMPLGKISKNQLAKGFEVLEDLKKAIEGGKKGASINELSSKFYTAIPHDFGRKVPPPITTAEGVQQKMDLLEVLGDIALAQNMLKEEDGKEVPDEVPHIMDQNFKKLNNGLKLVDKNSKEFKIIETYTYNTMGYRKVKIIDVWELERDGEFDRFSKNKELDNRKLLWHGTNVAVIVAILKTGLRIMPHSGGRVGRGLYFASENAKSAGYVGTTHDKGKNIGFMFLNEVALGKEHHITQDDSSLRKPPPGYDSVVAMGRVEPDQTKDVTIPGKFGDIVVPQGKALDRKEYANSSFFNSEYLVYDESQVFMHYMLKLEFS